MHSPDDAIVPPVSYTRCRLRDVPQPASWLSARERELAGTLRTEVRRRTWIHGRWTAKQAVMALAGGRAVPSRWSILQAPDGAPEAWLDGSVQPISVSLSHRAGRATAAAVASPDRVGCDLEFVEPRSDAFVRDYLVDEEQRFVREVPAGAERSLRANLVWCGKEALLKVLRQGLRRDTRTVIVRIRTGDPVIPGAGWTPFIVLDTGTGVEYDAWYRTEGNFVETVALAPAYG